MQCVDCGGCRHDGPCDKSDQEHSLWCEEQRMKLAHLRGTYMMAFDAYLKFMDQHPPARRKMPETNELSRLESVCMKARRDYEDMKNERHTFA